MRRHIVEELQLPALHVREPSAEYVQTRQPSLGVLESNTGLEGVLHYIDFTRTIGKTKLPDKRLRDLVQHFNKHRLRNEDFEFPDLLGAAYEYLIGQFADSAGKKGGEFYTPRSGARS